MTDIRERNIKAYVNSFRERGSTPSVWKALFSAAAFLSVLFLLLILSVPVRAGDGVAGDNIYVENVCVSGMNEEEIDAVIQQKMSEYSSSVITINVGEQSVDVTAGDLGLHITNPDITEKVLAIGDKGNIWKRFSINKNLSAGEQVIFGIQTDVSEDSVRSVVEARCTALNISRVDMTLAMSDDGTVGPSAKQDGVSVDVDETVEKICEYMKSDWFGGYGEIDASVTIDKAEGDEETYSKSKDIIGSGSTEFNVAYDSGRAANIDLAVAKINGTVLLPGEEFSAIEKMQPFTAEEGYQPAASIELGEIVDSYGGGVCQVSTTLYLAVLQAELDVTERCAHSMVMSYVEPSMDAAVAEGSKDFKFINNTDYPIYISASQYNGTISFNIYGCETRDPSRTIQYISETVEEKESQTVFVTDSSIPVGYYTETTGRDGLEARCVKIVYQDGAEVSRENVNYSNYQYSDHTVTIGVQGATSEQISAINSLLEGKDLTAIGSAIGGIQKADSAA